MGAGGNSGAGISESVREFLFQQIESYEQLEILLLLERNAPRSFTIAAVAAELGIGAEAAQAALEHLARRTLVQERAEPDGSSAFRYEPADPELDRIARLLARAYEERRLEIMQLMNANAIQRVRTAALRTFADAFIIRRKDG